MPPRCPICAICDPGPALRRHGGSVPQPSSPGARHARRHPHHRRLLRPPARGRLVRGGCVDPRSRWRGAWMARSLRRRSGCDLGRLTPRRQRAAQECSGRPLSLWGCLLRDLGGGRLSGPPTRVSSCTKRDRDRRCCSRPLRARAYARRSAGLKQTSSCCTESQTLGRRNTAHGAEHQARPMPQSVPARRRGRHVVPLLRLRASPDHEGGRNP